MLRPCSTKAASSSSEAILHFSCRKASVNFAVLAGVDLYPKSGMFLGSMHAG